MTFAELRREFADVTLGPQIWGLVVAVTRQIARSYPPAVYNAGESWTESTIEVLAQDVVVDRLLAERQLDYIFGVADDLGSFERLLTRQVRRTLSKRRSRTVVDRLLTRVDALAADVPLQIDDAGRDRWITSETDPSPFRTLDDQQIRATANSLADIPRIPESAGSSRASIVYTTPLLGELVQRVLAVHGGVSRSDLAKILEVLLTSWLPTFLDDIDTAVAAGTEAADDGVDRQGLAESVRAFAATFDETDRIVLICKSQDIADGQIAARVGRSRPWVADRKRALLGRIETELVHGVDGDTQGVVIDMLLSVVAAQMEEGTDGSP